MLLPSAISHHHGTRVREAIINVPMMINPALGLMVVLLLIIQLRI